MDAKKLKFDAASGLEDHFDFLSDELILCIFNKITDLKTLFHCYLVSKRFASLVSQIRTVPVALSGSEEYSCESYTRLRTLLREVSQLTGDELCGFHKRSFQKLKLPIFLEKFPKLESIYLEYTWPKNDDNTSLLKWRVNCTSEISRVMNFAAVLPASVHKTSDFVLGQELPTRKNSQGKDCLWSSYGCYTEWMFLIYTLINCHATLRSVTVTDSGKKGKLVISDEQLFRLRSLFPIIHLFDYRTAWVPELHLPVSGFVMGGVYLVAMKFRDESFASGEGDDIDMINWDFEEEDKVFGEVIKEVFKNHREKIWPHFKRSGPF